MEDENKNMIEKVSGNPIIKFLSPLPRKYLELIDNGKLFKQPFKALYSFFAVLNILVPIYLMYKAIDNKIWDAPFKFVIVFLFIWVLIAIASFFGFSIWWDRKNKVTSSVNESDSFIATPIFSHFIQTLGEFTGTYIAIVGSLGSLLIAIILGADSQEMKQLTYFDLSSYGWLGFLIMLLMGFGVIIVSRFVAEQFRAISAIANNTKK